MTILGALLVALLYVSTAEAQQPVAVTHSIISVGTTSTAVVSADSSRKYLELINISDTDIDCNIAGGTAVAGEGTRLKKNGGGRIYDVSVPFQAVACIHAGSGTKSLQASSGK